MDMSSSTSVSGQCILESREGCGLRARKRLVVLALIGSGVLVATAASAGTTLMSQDRRVRVTIEGTSSCTPGGFQCLPYLPLGPFSFEQTEIAPDFAAFDETVSVQNASASQYSSLTDTHIVAEGTMSAVGVLQFQMGGGIQALKTADTSARSHFSVTFFADTPTSFLLDGTLAASAAGFPSFGMQLQLQGPEGVVAEIECVPVSQSACGPSSEQITGVLAQGQYTLLAVATATGDPSTLGGPPASSGSGSYSLDLQLAPVLPVSLPGIGPLGGLALAALLATLGVRIGLPRSTL
jgi:hypothetical protein